MNVPPNFQGACDLVEHCIDFLGRQVRLSNAQALFGRERETIETAYPGDVVGIVGTRDVGIGDTLTEDRSIVFNEIPRFAPECFAYLHNPTPAMYKRFKQGLEQLLQEGVVQCFDLPGRAQKVPLLAAVGPLQFEIVQYRLESEYGAPSRLERAPWEFVRWFENPRDAAAFDDIHLGNGIERAVGAQGEPVLLFQDSWSERYFRQRTDVRLVEQPPGVRGNGVLY